jgi:hypothetical protein
VLAYSLVVPCLHSAVVAGPTGKIVLGVLALLSAVLGAVVLVDDLEAWLSRDPSRRGYEIEVDTQGVTCRDIHSVESVAWSRLGELECTDSEITFRHLSGSVYTTVPVSVSASAAEWNEFVELVEALRARAS